ncbi:L-aspartate oxidase [Natronospira proteinivora]|uniref:L-aspartate oxidase n=1 Tax=Natronospira proteinivora TaxID=1807133 RepID=A0ABT1G9P9_9GAMM|nr:L-aspartate oxidase [Natronospira proteinivora]MCP1726667.1 L-aspartate oxidase [Natronospira proteinivora]
MAGQSASIRRSYDAIILGTGAAGLAAALSLPRDWHVALVSKGPVDAGSTAWAQGGMSAAIDAGDSIESHVNDTLETGAGLGQADVVEYIARQAPKIACWLSELGVPFTRDADNHYHLTQEGGHRHRRVLHVADATGRAIQDTLQQAVNQRPHTHWLTRRTAVDLITSRRQGLAGDNRVLGVYALNDESRQVETLSAPRVMLATGGANKVYLYTSNPDGTTGDGIAMAWRVGCRVANMEFMQFHPTCLFHPRARSFLISEALRGEGAILRLPNGERFMHRFHPQAELAPRDVVARAIDHEMKRLGLEHVWLDISHEPAQRVRQQFPTIDQRLQALGIDLTCEPIPVVPAAHYTCGGVITDLAGRTDLPGLYAAGETAHTGLHGANRMASNSLLECLIMGRTAARDMANTSLPEPPKQLRDWDESQVTDSDEEIVVRHNWLELRRFMWDYVGIVRSRKRLRRAAARTALLRSEIQEYYADFRVNADLLELRNLAEVAELVIRCAQARRESRGLHYNLDYPHTLPADQARDTILVPNNWPGRAQAPQWSLAPDRTVPQPDPQATEVPGIAIVGGDKQPAKDP